MIDSGLADYWQRKHWPSISYHCSHQQDSKISHHRPLTMEDMQSAFLIILLGLALSFTVFLGELFVATCNRNMYSPIDRAIL